MIFQPVDPVLAEPPPPPADGIDMHPDIGGDRGIGPAVGSGQHDPGANHHPMLGTRTNSAS